MNELELLLFCLLFLYVRVLCYLSWFLLFKIEIEVLLHILHMMWRDIICCTQEWVAKVECFLNELSFLAFVLVCQAVVFSLMVSLC